MRKKKWIVVALAAALAVQGSYAFAASSSSSDDNNVVTTPQEPSNQPSSPVIVAGSGEKTETTETPATTPTKETVTVTTADGSSSQQINVVTAGGGAAGTTIGVVVDTTTTDGTPITTNEKGEVVIGNTTVAIENTAAVAATLPAEVAETVNNINAGKPLQETVTDVDLTGYNALTGTNTIVTKDAATGQVKTGEVEISVYVPNLVENLGEVSVLFYDNATGKWVVLPVTRVDLASKVVSVKVPGSGTMSVVYKK